MWINQQCHQLHQKEFGFLHICYSLESSGLSESSGINLHNQKMCTSCDENLVGAYKCQECDILCQIDFW